MQPYLVTATDAQGRRDTFAREAASIPHLRAALERDGYTDIAFEDDDFTVHLRTLRPDFLPKPDEAALKMEARGRRSAKLDSGIGAWARHNGWVLLLAAVAIAYGTWRERWWLVAVAAAAVASMLWIHFRWGRRNRAYDALLRVWAHGEWEQARAMIEAMQADRGLHGIEMLMVDLRFRAACLRARRGELAEALADVAPLRDSPQGAKGVFESRVGSIHLSAGDVAGFLRCSEAAWVASGHAPMQQLDLAFAHARVGDAQRSRDVLAGLERRNLMALHQPVATAAEGILAARAGDPAAGASLLGDADRALEEFANPAVWPIHALVVGHRALAVLDAGHPGEARAVIAEWRPMALAWIDADARRRIETELSA